MSENFFAETERTPRFQEHLTEFLADPVAALRTALEALEDGTFASTYDYLGLADDWLDDWCLVLDELVGKLVTELHTDRYNSATFAPLVQELVSLSSTSDESLELRLRLFKLAGVPKEKMVEYFQHGQVQLSDQQRQLIAAMYDERRN